MKDEFNRIIATGMLALLIANFAACDEISQEDINNSVITDTSGNIVAVDPGGFTTSTSQNPYDELGGSIWKNVRNSGAMSGDKIYSNEIYQQGLPLEFLTQEGLIYMQDNGWYAVNGENQPTDRYNPFTYRAFVNPNSSENEVYLLIQYASDDLGQNENNENIYLATYMLQYELDDDNYETFLKLDGDRTIKHFIQEMDRQFEEKVIFKSVVAQNMVVKGSHVSKEHWSKKGFPNIFVSNVDYNNAVLTYGAVSPEGLRYWDVDIRKTGNWEAALDVYGISEEEREGMINMQTINTPVGSCLIEFDIGELPAGYNDQQCKEAYNTTDHIQELQEIDINSQEKTLTSGR